MNFCELNGPGSYQTFGNEKMNIFITPFCGVLSSTLHYTTLHYTTVHYSREQHSSAVHNMGKKDEKSEKYAGPQELDRVEDSGWQCILQESVCSASTFYIIIRL